jgi:hypothetical protein
VTVPVCDYTLVFKTVPAWREPPDEVLTVSTNNQM